MENNINIVTVVRMNINKYRKMKNLTMQELADKSDLSHGYIRDLECIKIKKTPSIEAIYRIALALDVSVDKFFIQ